VWARFSTSFQAGRGAHSASYTMGTGSFPGVKRPGSGVDHPLSSSVTVQGRVELCMYSLSPTSRPVLIVTFYISLRGPVSNQKHCKLNWKVSFTQIHLGWRTFIHVYSSNVCCIYVAQLVGALQYKPEGCEFVSRLGHWNF
jgi:hypothetical protein